jgi:hypothetical protein
MSIPGRRLVEGLSISLETQTFSFDNMTARPDRLAVLTGYRRTSPGFFPKQSLVFSTHFSSFYQRIICTMKDRTVAMIRAARNGIRDVAWHPDQNLLVLLQMNAWRE